MCPPFEKQHSHPSEVLAFSDALPIQFRAVSDLLSIWSSAAPRIACMRHTHSFVPGFFHFTWHMWDLCMLFIICFLFLSFMAVGFKETEAKSPESSLRTQANCMCILKASSKLKSYVKKKKSFPFPDLWFYFSASCAGTKVVFAFVFNHLDNKTKAGATLDFAMISWPISVTEITLLISPSPEINNCSSLTQPFSFRNDSETSSEVH